MIDHVYSVYILASKRNGTLYIGVTANLIERVYEHKNHLVDGFTKKYNVHNLVSIIWSIMKQQKILAVQ